MWVGVYRGGDLGEVWRQTVPLHTNQSCGWSGKSHLWAHGWVVCIDIWIIELIGVMETLVVGRNFAGNLVIGSTGTVKNKGVRFAKKNSHLETVSPSGHVPKRSLDVVLDYRKERDIELKPYVFETTWMLYLYLEKIIDTINRGYLISSNDKNDTGINRNVPNNI